MVVLFLDGRGCGDVVAVGVDVGDVDIDGASVVVVAVVVAVVWDGGSVVVARVGVVVGIVGML